MWGIISAKRGSCSGYYHILKHIRIGYPSFFIYYNSLQLHRFTHPSYATEIAVDNYWGTLLWLALFMAMFCFLPKESCPAIVLCKMKSSWHAILLKKIGDFVFLLGMLMVYEANSVLE